MPCPAVRERATQVGSRNRGRTTGSGISMCQISDGRRLQMFMQIRKWIRWTFQSTLLTKSDKTPCPQPFPAMTGGYDIAHEVKGHDEELTNQMPAGMLPVMECVICLETYKFGAMLCGLPCGHSFHHQCIMGWLSRDNHCCPVCRWPTYKAKPCSIHLHAE